MLTKLPLLSKDLKHIVEGGKAFSSGSSSAREIIAKYHNTRSTVEGMVSTGLEKQEEGEDEDDESSCSSSELFELENLDMKNMDVYQKELPVYESSHFMTNKSIAEVFIFFIINAIPPVSLHVI